MNEHSLSEQEDNLNDEEEEEDRGCDAPIRMMNRADSHLSMENDDAMGSDDEEQEEDRPMRGRTESLREETKRGKEGATKQKKNKHEFNYEEFFSRDSYNKKTKKVKDKLT